MGRNSRYKITISLFVVRGRSMEKKPPISHQELGQAVCQELGLDVTDLKLPGRAE